MFEYLKIDDEFIPTDFETIRNIFLNPEITNDYVLDWVQPDEIEVIHILCDLHQFNKSRVKDLIKKFEKDLKITKQETLF